MVKLTSEDEYDKLKRRFMILMLKKSIQDDEYFVTKDFIKELETASDWPLYHCNACGREFHHSSIRNPECSFCGQDKYLCKGCGIEFQDLDLRNSHEVWDCKSIIRNN